MKLGDLIEFTEGSIVHLLFLIAAVLPCVENFKRSLGLQYFRSSGFISHRGQYETFFSGIFISDFIPAVLYVENFPGTINHSHSMPYNECLFLKLGSAKRGLVLQRSLK